MPLPSTEPLLICLLLLLWVCRPWQEAQRHLLQLFSNLSCNSLRSSCFIWIVNPARMAECSWDRTGKKEHLLLHRSFQSCSRKSFKGAGERNNTRPTHSVAEPHGSCSDSISVRWTNPESDARQVRQYLWVGLSSRNSTPLEEHELFFRTSKCPGQHANFGKLIRTWSISVSKTTRDRRWNATAVLVVLQVTPWCSPWGLP